MPQPSDSDTPQSDYPTPFQHATLRDFVQLDGKNVPIYGYSIHSRSITWPKISGIYSVARDYPDGSRRHLVGKTGDFHARWIRHLHTAKHGRHGNPYFQASYDKHDGLGFVFWVLEADVSDEKSGEREAFWYRLLRSDKNLNGWNILIPTDEGTCRLAEETKLKLREINLGNKHTEETCQKMSNSRKGENNCNWGKKGTLNPLFGRKWSDERRRQLSESTTGPNNHGWGKHHTQEHRDKISRGNPKNKPVLLRSPEGEEMEFVSIHRAEKECHFTSGSLRWFLQCAAVGDIFQGWTLLRQHADSPRKRRYRLSMIRLKDPTGAIFEVRSLAGLAKELGVPKGQFYRFVHHAEVGATFHGYTKLEPYQKPSYV